MTVNKRPLILLTNDDGIGSPGIRAAAEVLCDLGELIIVAPREQSSATGRSHPLTSDGKIEKIPYKIEDCPVRAYAVGGTPAQCVVRALVQVLDRKPDLVVSGINYGENFGVGITISGTIGAALEAASYGIPALAASLQLLNMADFETFNPEIDFRTAGFFTRQFAQVLLNHTQPEIVDVLKLEVPANATPETPWRMTRLARHNYYEPFTNVDADWNQPERLSYRIGVKQEEICPDSDIHTVIYDQHVSVTPLTIDLTAPIDLKELEDTIRKNGYKRK
jgi:5'-nucleotidase